MADKAGQDAAAYAFKCRNCGHLEDGANAGTLDTPAACRSCGHGVRFDPINGIKSLNPDNWIVLADLDGPDLAGVLEFHAIDASQIVRHLPAIDPPSRGPRNIDRSASEGAGAGDDSEGVVK